MGNERTLFFSLGEPARLRMRHADELVADNRRAEKSNLINRLQYGNGRWIVYNSHLDSYMWTFSSIGSKEEVTCFLEGRARAGEKVYVMDFMGEGTVVRDIAEMIDGGMFVTLVDLRSLRKRVFDLRHGIIPIIGNILLRSTWAEMRTKAKKHGLPGFDLIFCRPEGAGEALESGIFSTEPYAIVLQQLFSFLKPNGGVLYAQIPYIVNKQADLSKWAEQLERMDNTPIRVEIRNYQSSPDNFVMKLTRLGPLPNRVIPK